MQKYRFPSLLLIFLLMLAISIVIGCGSENDAESEPIESEEAPKEVPDPKPEEIAGEVEPEPEVEAISITVVSSQLNPVSNDNAITLVPSQGDMVFLINGVTDATTRFMEVPDNLMYYFNVFNIEEPSEISVKLILTAPDGTSVERTNAVEITESGENTLEAVMLASSSDPGKYSADLFINNNLVDSAECEK